MHMECFRGDPCFGWTHGAHAHLEIRKSMSSRKDLAISIMEGQFWVCFSFRMDTSREISKTAWSDIDIKFNMIFHMLVWLILLWWSEVVRNIPWFHHNRFISCHPIISQSYSIQPPIIPKPLHATSVPTCLPGRLGRKMPPTGCQQPPAMPPAG